MFKEMIDYTVILAFFTFFGIMIQLIILPGRTYPCIGLSTA